MTSVADESEELNEEQYAEQLRTFRTHAAVYAAVNLGIFLVNLAINLAAGIADIWWAWWSAWSIIGWGIGLAAHGLVVRGQRPAPQRR